MATTFKPTEEQISAVDAARTGGSLKIEALAGAGKTSTLRLISEAIGGRGQYLAFNKKIVTDAQASFPSNVTCSTAHSLAMRAVGRRYAHRLNGRRITQREIAQNLGLDLDTPFVFDRDDEVVELDPTTVAGMAARMVLGFCQSADARLAPQHAPWQKGLDAKGEYSNNERLTEILLPLARKIWEDVRDPNGEKFRFEHNHYLKLWALEGPVISSDFILFDEAQDANPLMLQIVEAQAGQRIYVGDSQQQIYGWNGAVNALERADASTTRYLTKSFRFGPEIAEQANLILDRLEAGVTVEGAGKPGRVGEVDAPDVWLGRTNAAVVSRALAEMDAGREVCIQGGTREIVWFAEEAEKLQHGRKSNHPELMCFADWSAVVKYVEEDEFGQDLRLLVGLVEDYGAEELAHRLKRAVDPHRADVTVSTAHKSKGAEWGAVRLIEDFPAGEDVVPEELRLLYVAVTRAQVELDVNSVDMVGAPQTLTEMLRGVKSEQEVDAALDVQESEAEKGLGVPSFVEAARRAREALTGSVNRPRAISLDRARAILGDDAGAVKCGFCGADPGDPCLISRGPRAGKPTLEPHADRVEGAVARWNHLGKPPKIRLVEV